MKKIFAIILLLCLSADGQVLRHYFDSPKSDTAASRPIKPSHWDDYLVPKPESSVYIWDDFRVGNYGTNGQVGRLSWGFTATSSATNNGINGTANHPGIDSMATGTSTSGSGGALALYLDVNAAIIGCVHQDAFFDMLFWVKLSADANDSMVVRIGLANTPALTNFTLPGDGIYLDIDTLRSQWRGVLKNAGETQTGNIAAQSTNWAKLRIRRIDFATDSIEYCVDASCLRLAVTDANFPNVSMSPFLFVHNADRPTAKSIQVDHFEMLIKVQR